MSPADHAIIWFDVHTVSFSPSHAAIVACGSIIAWLWSGVVYRASSWTGAAANAAAKSPTALSGSVPNDAFGLIAVSIAAARS